MPLREWSSATQLAKLDRDFEDVISHFMSHDWGVAKPYAGSHQRPAIDSFIDNDRFILRADLPGVDPKDVEVSVEGNVLTIRGCRVGAAEDAQRDFVHREIKYGSFERTISIPNGVKKEEISAAYRNGVLELTIPLDRAAEVRRVPVLKGTRAREPERRQ
jgi:HSP20 family protein